MTDQLYESSTLTLEKKNSVNYDIVSSYLYVCAKTSKVTIGNFWKIVSPALEYSFNNKRKNKLTIPCWVPLSSLSDKNDPQNICNRGFIIEEDGLLVEFGTITFSKSFNYLFNSQNENENEDNVGNNLKISTTNFKNNSYFMQWIDELDNLPDKNSEYYFFCDVCVGYCKEVDSIDEAEYFKRYSLPIGFDSLIISTEDIETNAKSNDNYEVKKKTKIFESPSQVNLIHKMYNSVKTPIPVKKLLPSLTRTIKIKIFDSNQIYPRFLVRVDLLNRAPEYFGADLCANCKEKKCQIYCFSDNVELCEECDESIHSANAILKRHQRISVAKAPQKVMGNCEIHCLKQYTHYCVICELPICELCYSYHKHDANSDEHIIPLLDAYYVLINESEKKNIGRSADMNNYVVFDNQIGEILTQRKSQLLSHINEINGIIQNVNEKELAAQQSVRKIIQNVADQLMLWSEKNLANALSKQLYYLIILNDLHKSTDFIEYLSKILPPADFLRCWLNYCKYVNEIKENIEKNAIVKTIIKPKLEGEINVQINKI